jgi:hypothetical protein
VPGMVGHSGHPLDDLGHARQRPQVVVEPGRHRAAVQHPADPGQLGRPSWAGLPWRAVRIPAAPPLRQRAYQRLAVCADTPSSAATSARVSPWANRSAACSRRRSNHCRSPGCRSTRPLGVTADRLMTGSITHSNHQLPRSSVVSAEPPATQLSRQTRTMPRPWPRQRLHGQARHPDGRRDGRAACRRPRLAGHDVLLRDLACPEATSPTACRSVRDHDTHRLRSMSLPWRSDAPDHVATHHAAN